jgi:hypothetical protein
MNGLRAWLAVLLLALFAVAAGQESDQVDDDASPPAESPDDAPDAGDFDLDEDWELPEIPAGIFGDDIFIPSEEIAADEEIVFPVDI